MSPALAALRSGAPAWVSLGKANWRPAGRRLLRPARPLAPVLPPAARPASPLPLYQPHPSYDLLVRAARGDEQAFAQFFGLWHGRVRRYAEAIIGSYDQADDAAALAFLKIREHAMEGRLPSEAAGVPGWTLTRAKWAAFEVRAAHGREVAVENPEWFAGSVDPEAAERSASDEDRDKMIHAAAAAFAQLCPRHQAVVRARAEGLSWRQVAARVGLGEAAVQRVNELALSRLVKLTHDIRASAANKNARLPEQIRATVVDAVATIRRRKPAISIPEVQREVCRRAGVWIGRESPDYFLFKPAPAARGGVR